MKNSLSLKDSYEYDMCIEINKNLLTIWQSSESEKKVSFIQDATDNIAVFTRGENFVSTVNYHEIKLFTKFECCLLIRRACLTCTTRARDTKEARCKPRLAAGGWFRKLRPCSLRLAARPRDSCAAACRTFTSTTLSLSATLSPRKTECELL